MKSRSESRRSKTAWTGYRIDIPGQVDIPPGDASIPPDGCSGLEIDCKIQGAYLACES